MKKRSVKRIALLMGMSLFVLFSGSGCAQSTMIEEDTRFNVGVVLKSADSEHWQGVRSGMENAAKEQNVTLTLLYPQDEWAEDEQRVMIQDLLESDIDALIVSPCNSTDTGWFVDLAKEKNIALFTADTRALDRVIPFVGIDNEEVGRLAARYLHARLPADAKIALLAGADKQGQTLDRVASFKAELEVLQSELQVTVIKEIKGFADALHETKRMLGEGISGIFCCSAVMGLGAAAAEQELELDGDLCIVTIDSQTDAIKAVQRGTVDALITQSGYDVGEMAVKTVVKHLEGGPSDNVYIPCEVLTRDNINEFITKSEEQS